MLFTKYQFYKLKTIFAIIILVFLPVRVHSETAYLTEAKKTDSEVCQFAEFSRAFAKERDKRKLDCKYVLNFNSDISSDETHQQIDNGVSSSSSFFGTILSDGNMMMLNNQKHRFDSQYIILLVIFIVGICMCWRFLYHGKIGMTKNRKDKL